MNFTLLELASVDSTNSLALDLYKQAYASGTVVVAKHQYAGRGRLQRQWLMNDGDLAMSVLLAKADLPEPSSLLALIPAVAVVEVLNRHQITALIKWPNDIVVKNPQGQRHSYFGAYQKLAGILVENAWAENQLAASVIGIGLNIVKNTFINEHVAYATSLFDLGLTIDRRELLLEILSSIDKYLKSSCDSIMELYQRSCVSIGAEISWQYKNQTIVGLGCGINQDGSLRAKSNNTMHNVYAGDVNFCA